MAGRRASRGPASSAATIICSTSSASRSSIPTSAARPATASASSASTTGRRCARTASGTSAPSSTGCRPIRRSIRPASRSPAAPMAAICATPRRSATATGCAPPIASSPSPTSSPSSKTPRAYRRDLRRVEYGDERDPAQRAELIAISPLTRVARARIPLMVVTGANDPRVPASEADQMVARGPRQRPHRLASARPERGPRLRQEGESGLSVLDQPDVLAGRTCSATGEIGKAMAVSIIDGTIEAAELKRVRGRLRSIDVTPSRLADGGTKTVLKPIVYSDLGGRSSQPGRAGASTCSPRSTIAASARPARRQAATGPRCTSPANNEMRDVVAALLMGRVGAVCVMVGIHSSIWPCPLRRPSFLICNTRIEAERQFAQRRAGSARRRAPARPHPAGGGRRDRRPRLVLARAGGRLADCWTTRSGVCFSCSSPCRRGRRRSRSSAR